MDPDGNGPINMADYCAEDRIACSRKGLPKSETRTLGYNRIADGDSADECIMRTLITLLGHLQDKCKKHQSWIWAADAYLLDRTKSLQVRMELGIVITPVFIEKD